MPHPHTPSPGREGVNNHLYILYDVSRFIIFDCYRIFLHLFIILIIN